MRTTAYIAVTGTSIVGSSPDFGQIDAQWASVNSDGSTGQADSVIVTFPYGLCNEDLRNMIIAAVQADLQSRSDAAAIADHFVFVN